MALPGRGTQRDEPQEHRVQQVGGSSRPLGAAVAVMVLLLVLLVVKPWGGVASLPRASADPGQSADPQERATRAPAPTPDAIRQDILDRRQCQAHDAWQLITMERTGQTRTRSLISVDPVRADDPTDPRIETHVFYAAQLRAIGYCVPSTQPHDIAAYRAAVLLWRVDSPDQASVIKDTVVVDSSLASVGEVYLAPRAGRGASSGWTPGRYVFEIQGPKLSGASDWFAIQFQRVGS